MARPPGEPIVATNRPSRSRTTAGDIDERGRFRGPTALAAEAPAALVGANEKSVSWLLSMKPSTIRPSPKTLSTVVVIETTLPHLSTTVNDDVPPGSTVASGPFRGAPGGLPAAGGDPAFSPISFARA